jgi:hypothetical protein
LNDSIKSVTKKEIGNNFDSFSKLFPKNEIGNDFESFAKTCSVFYYGKTYLIRMGIEKNNLIIILTFLTFFFLLLHYISRRFSDAIKRNDAFG